MQGLTAGSVVLALCGVLGMAFFFLWLITTERPLKFWWAVALETISLGIGVLLMAVCLAWYFGVHEPSRVGITAKFGL